MSVEIKILIFMHEIDFLLYVERKWKFFSSHLDLESTSSLMIYCLTYRNVLFHISDQKSMTAIADEKAATDLF